MNCKKSASILVSQLLTFVVDPDEDSVQEVLQVDSVSRIGKELIFELQVDEELGQLDQDGLVLDGLGPGVADEAHVEVELVALVLFILENDGMPADLFVQDVDSQKGTEKANS